MFKFDYFKPECDMKECVHFELWAYFVWMCAKFKLNRKMPQCYKARLNNNNNKMYVKCLHICFYTVHMFESSFSLIFILPTNPFRLYCITFWANFIISIVNWESCSAKRGFIGFGFRSFDEIWLFDFDSTQIPTISTMLPSIKI